jgi:hypothetical protein
MTKKPALLPKGIFGIWLYVTYVIMCRLSSFNCLNCIVLAPNVFVIVKISSYILIELLGALNLVSLLCYKIQLQPYWSSSFPYASVCLWSRFLLG